MVLFLIDFLMLELLLVFLVDLVLFLAEVFAAALFLALEAADFLLVVEFFLPDFLFAGIFP